MKKFSRLAAFLIISASFAAPLLAVAGTRTIGQLCYENDDCVSGLVCTSNSTCQSSVGGTRTTSGGIDPSILQGYSASIIDVINDILVPVLFAVAFITFLWGVYQYFILGAANEEERKKGRQFVLWGIIGFFIIGSLWGLVNIVKQTLIPAGVNSNAPPTPLI